MYYSFKSLSIAAALFGAVIMASPVLASDGASHSGAQQPTYNRANGQEQVALGIYFGGGGYRRGYWGGYRGYGGYDGYGYGRGYSYYGYPYYYNSYPYYYNSYPYRSYYYNRPYYYNYPYRSSIYFRW